MVPNYRDSLPLELNHQVAQLVREAETRYVPGHGPLATANDLTHYQQFLTLIQESSRRSYDAGMEAEQAAREFVLPAPFADWFIYAPEVMPVAFSAWYQQFETDK
jgi:hypothetical protein